MRSEVVPPLILDVAAKRGYPNVQLIGKGLEFQVFEALTADNTKKVVLRCPAGDRFQSNANDRYVDTRALLQWEHTVASHVAAHGIPVATPLELILGDIDVLVSDYVPDDGRGADQTELGTLLRRLHAIPPPPAPSVAGGTAPPAEVISRRITARWQELSTAVPGLPAGFAARELAAVLAGQPATSLVHLDVRAANLRCVSGRVLGLLDWSNALVGDPLLELGRLAEFARLEGNKLDLAPILAGYGASADILTLDRPELLVYRLDAAVMLAVVFLFEAPDDALGQSALDRVLEIHARLNSLLPLRRPKNCGF
jgi:aminoglycoside phosphotransferase (APT) family kinase protein